MANPNTSSPAIPPATPIAGDYSVAFNGRTLQGRVYADHDNALQFREKAASQSAPAPASPSASPPASPPASPASLAWRTTDVAVSAMSGAVWTRLGDNSLGEGWE